MEGLARPTWPWEPGLGPHWGRAFGNVRTLISNSDTDLLELSEATCYSDHQALIFLIREVGTELPAESLGMKWCDVDMVPGTWGAPLGADDCVLLPRPPIFRNS